MSKLKQKKYISVSNKQIAHHRWLTIINLKMGIIFVYVNVPTPLEGGRNYILKWVFYFSQYLGIDIFITESCEWYP